MKRGRPRRDQLALVEQVVALLAEDAELSANAVVERVRARRSDVLRAFRLVRKASAVSQR